MAGLYEKIYIILIIIALPLPALAAYHYAGHSGSNAFTYTSWETAADTIQNAVNAASNDIIGYNPVQKNVAITPAN